MKKLNLYALLFASFVLAGCQEASEPEVTGEAPESVEPEQSKPLVSGIDVNNMDTSVRPGDDFFRYVNGQWLDANPIPDDRSAFDAFAVLRDAA